MEKCLLRCAPVLSNSLGAALCALEPCREGLCLWGRGTAVRCLQQRLPPQAGTACPLPCAMSPQTAEEPSHLGTARPARLLPAIQRAPSWEPRCPGGAQQPTGGTRSHPVRVVGWYRRGHTRLGAAPLLSSLHSILGTRAALPET